MKPIHLVITLILILFSFFLWRGLAQKNLDTISPTPGDVTPPAMEVEKQKISVFFSSKKEDPETLNCDLVFPLTRFIPGDDKAVARAALTELFRGLSPEEKAAGYFTLLPEGLSVGSLTITDGVATVDVLGPLQGGGSCRIAAIYNQIEETLTQFPTISSIVLLVNGEAEALQP